MARFICRHFLAAYVLLIAVPTCLCAPQETDCERAASGVTVTELGERRHFSESFPDYRNSDVIQAEAETKYLRVLVRVSNPRVCADWLLTVRDKNYRIVQTMTRDDFGAGFRWTNRIYGDRATFELTRCKGSTGPGVIFEEYTAMPNKAKNTYYSALDPSHPRYTDLYPDNLTTVPSEDRHLGDSVGFLMSSWTDGIDAYTWSCSGVLVAPDLFLTNWHCGGPRMIGQNEQKKAFPQENYWQPAIVNNTIIDLSWDGDDLSREYICTEKLEANQELDFALLRILALNSLGPAVPATIKLAPITQSTSIRIVHHPLGKPKQITYTGCGVVNAEHSSWTSDKKTDFTHNCDTEGGSSGAPVFNQAGQLIGLHHLGYDFDPATCKRKDSVNKAVRMDKIIEFLKKQPNSAADRFQFVSTER